MKKIIITLGVIFLFLGIGHTIGAQHFSQRFLMNTSFANIDISHLTKEEANAKITRELENHTLTLKENNEPIGSVTLGDLDPQINLTPQLDSLIQEQNQTTWLNGLFNDSNYEGVAEGDLVINQEKLSTTIDSITLSDTTRLSPTDATIEYSEEMGYYIEPEQIGTEINQDKLFDLVLDGLREGQTTVEVSEAYLEPDITSTDESLLSELDQLKVYNNLQITLTIAGYEEVITPELISSWLYIDEFNEVNFDEDMIYEYLGTLNERYATYDDYRTFNSTLQGEVQLLPGTLGWSIDREAETQAILADLQAAVPVVREPTIVGIGYNGTLDDIGNSYIEVDILNQTMFVYIDGNQVLSTPVVTGQIGTNTIPGAYAIWNLESPSELKGYNPRTEKDYVQPVEFWLAFDYTGQGIHDANWQPYFGGDAYLVNGSLGCINTPPDIMPIVFEYAYPGMPVIVFE